MIGNRANRNRNWKLIAGPAWQLGTAVSLLALAAFAPIKSFAQQAFKESVLYTFTGGADGAGPNGSLIADTGGNLYGTTYGGGAYGFGTVYKVDSSGNETVLYSFTGGTDGKWPLCALVRDKAGNLYGTTNAGGSYGYGVVFRLDTIGNETVLHAFTGGADGAYPDYGGLLLDGRSDLYGVTANGGNGSDLCAGVGCGVVFKLDPAGNETVLYTFTGGADGGGPHGQLILDSAGNFYGTTYWGGVGNGVVFKLDLKGTETVLYTFSVSGQDGLHPVGGVLRDASGNLYGTTSAGGPNGGGEVFELSLGGAETVLYGFTGGADGALPYSSLVRDAAGNLYGTSLYGGNVNIDGPCGTAGCGVVFRVTSGSKETVLYTFTGKADGANPDAALLPYKGSFNATTTAGGTASGSLGFGVVFQVSANVGGTSKRDRR